MKLKNIKILETLLNNMEAFQTALEAIIQDEQEAFDNLSESYQNSEKGEVRQEQIDMLQEASDTMCDVISNCYSAME